MNRYSAESMSFTDILKRAFRLHYLTLKHVIIPIILITVIKYAYMLASMFVTNTIAGFAVDVIAIAAVVFCLSAAFLTTHQAFSDQPITITASFRQIGQKALMIYGAFVAYIAGIFLVYEIMNGLYLLAHKYIHAPSAIHNSSVLLGIAMVMVFVAMFAFVWPLAVIENKTVWGVFSESAVLTEKNKFGILILFLLLGATWLLVSPAAVHEYLLSTYHLDVVFDFVVLSVAIPLLTNIVLLLVSDSKQRSVTIDFN